MDRYTPTLFLTIFIFSSCFAQALVTDRPDFTESVYALSARTLQIESGLEYHAAQGVKEWSYPNTLLRLGLGHSLEVRLGVTGWTNIRIDSYSQTYLNDLRMEAKYQITKKDAIWPFAVLLVSTWPTGDKAVSAGSAEMGLKLACSRQLSARLELGMNIGAVSVESGDHREFYSLASLSMGLSLSDQWGLFLETFAEMPPNQTWQPTMDAGVTLILSEATQWDFYVGRGLAHSAGDWTVGTGFSFRLGR